MSEKLTVAELLARNAKAGGKSSSDRPRRHRNLEDGGVSVSELTGSIPVVKLADENGADAVADANSTPDAPVEARTTSIDDAEVQTAAIEIEPESVETEPVETEATTGQRDGEVPDVTPETTPEAAPVVVLGDEPETEIREAHAELADQQGVPTEVASEEAPAATSAAATVVAPAAAADLSTELSGEQAPSQDQAQAPVSRGDEIVEYEDDSVSWPALLGQSALAVIVGVLIFFGFTVLWDNLGTAMVLVMALVVTFVCVGVVHALLRHRDTILLALTFIVVIALTVGPRLIMSL